ncbi:MAG: hypothetical protein LCI00_32575 [Chloroflexi bacterium]|nr:hypothetical protein [Chloroflexota bacterium]MCC6894676.1 hypothetical protein [Anaerolineae bacterium]
MKWSWGADEMYLVPTKRQSLWSVARTACLLSLRRRDDGTVGDADEARLIPTSI